MEVNYDEQGNAIAVVVQGSSKTKKRVRTQASPKEKVNDVQIATQALEAWKKPVAYQSGQFWSYDDLMGWSVCTDAFQNLCNDLRGSNTEQTVMKIVASRCKLPDLELCETHSTYWELSGESWIPFAVTSSQVLFSNGLLDLGDMTFTPTKNRVIFGPRISVPYTDDTFDHTCQEFLSLLEHALPNEEERVYLQRLCGLMLQPHTILRGQIVFWGVPHSGKTTLATAIATAPAGVRGQAAVNEGRLIADKWATTMLTNKFANVSNDSEFTPKWEAFMKQYTSGSFTVEAKFSKPVTVPTTAKLISTCNEMQDIQDTSGAAAQRYRIFRFKNAIVESGSTSQSEMMLTSYWANMDKRLGIIAWQLKGLADALEFGLTEPECMKIAKAEAIYESNPMMDFIANQVVKAPGEFMKVSDLNEALALAPHNPQNKQVAKIMERIWNVRKTKRRLANEPNPLWGYADLKLSTD